MNNIVPEIAAMSLYSTGLFFLLLSVFKLFKHRITENEKYLSLIHISSEILAAAVKDNSSNALVGTNTFGKGIVQVSGTLEDGSALKLTTMQYFSPKGSVINGKGVKPDYVVKNTAKMCIRDRTEPAIRRLKTLHL